ncbi:hypothetical protein GGH95_004045, partial [Coemansia sp. RSA 1836]
MNIGKPAQAADPAAGDQQRAPLTSPEHTRYAAAPVPMSLAYRAAWIDCRAEPSVQPSAPAAVTDALRDQNGGRHSGAVAPGHHHRLAMLHFDQGGQAARIDDIGLAASSSSSRPRRLQPPPALSLSALLLAALPLPPPPSSSSQPLLSLLPPSSISSSSPLGHSASALGISQAPFQHRPSLRLSPSFSSLPNSQYPVFSPAYSLHPGAATTAVLGHSRQHSTAPPAVGPNYAFANSRRPYNYEYHSGCRRTRNHPPVAHTQPHSASSARAAAHTISGHKPGLEMSLSSSTTASITTTTSGAAVYSPYAHPRHSTGYSVATGIGTTTPVPFSTTSYLAATASSGGAGLGSSMAATVVTPVHTTTSTAASSESPQVAASSSSAAAAALAAAAASRVNQACASCRRKKVRCDGVQPSCGNCVNRSISCTYLAQKKRGRPPKVQARQSSMPYYSPPSLATSAGASAASTSASGLAAAVSGLSPAQIGTTQQASPGVASAFGTSQGTSLALSLAADSLSQAPATAPVYFSNNWHSSTEAAVGTSVDAQAAILAGAHVAPPGASVGFYQQPLAYSG